MGRRWGKSFMATSYALSCADLGATVAWIAPTYRNSRPLWRAAERAVAPVAHKLTVRRSEREIVFPSGGSLFVYSADNPDAMRGMSFDLVIIDEASRVSEESWTDVIQPTLADRGGRAMLISTPVGRNWFYREWLKGRQHSERIASFQAPSSANPMPTIREAFERARETVSDRTFRQEWLAEFVDDGGGVFRSVTDAVRAKSCSSPNTDHTYVAGLDWALSNDYTVLTVIDQTTREVAHIERFTMMDYAAQRARIHAVCQRYNVYLVVAESNAMGKPNNDELRRMGVRLRDFNTTNLSKAAAIESLAAAFDHREIGIYDHRELIEELQAYEGSRLDSGAMRYGAPDGMHDDMVMSLALAWQACGSQSMWGA
jgi:phage terminase large subunit-like protein